jgi:hypothetical protein|tara:strand:- start:141 stop:398 length:258 start_codon:yes stop_codon:yes gene_type:complete
LEKQKVIEVISKFFDSMKDEENKILETGLSQHQTVDALKQVALLSAQDYPEKFEVYVKWFLSSSMYLLDENDELDDIEQQLRLAR